MRLDIRNNKWATMLVVLFGILFANYISPYHFVINKTASIPEGVYFVSPLRGMPHKGDIVIFAYEPLEWMKANDYFDYKELLMKRVKGLPFETISCSNNTYYLCVNEACETLESPVTKDYKGRPTTPWCQTQTLKNSVFVIGDAPNSLDSRFLGPIDGNKLLGKATPILTY